MCVITKQKTYYLGVPNKYFTVWITNGLLAKIIQFNLTNKIKAQFTKLFFVSCAFYHL